MPRTLLSTIPHSSWRPARLSLRPAQLQPEPRLGRAGSPRAAVRYKQLVWLPKRTNSNGLAVSSPLYFSFSLF